MCAQEHVTRLEGLVDRAYGLLGYKPYDYQRRAWREIINIGKTGGTLLLESPTASGKTEAVTLPFIAQCFLKEAIFSRLIYVLPNKSLVHLVEQRIRETAKKICGDINEASIGIEEGLKPTHMFLHRINITTWDSFLYGLASHRVINKRFTFPTAAIAGSLIVFDEIQMYQDNEYYTPHIIGLVYKMLSSSRIPIVFMTATMPSTLIDIIGIEPEAKIISHEKGDKHKPSRGTVDINIIEYCGEEEAINEILKLMKMKPEEGKVLIVRNTVRKAVKTYLELKKLYNQEQKNPTDKILLLHSRFMRADRKKKENEIINSKIIVSTQVIEAGLDLEGVSLLITDIAPLDALIQRIGRVARRKNERGIAYILVPKEECIESAPYNSMLITGTMETIKKNRIELNRMLSENDFLKKALDNIYSGVIKTFTDPSKYYETYLYFEELKLFTPPPEELTPSARPELFLHLYLPTEENLCIEKIENNLFSQQDIQSIINRTITISLPIIQGKEQGENIRKYTKKIEWLKKILLKQNDKQTITYTTIDLKNKKLKPVKTIEAYQIYIVNPQFYDTDTGLVTEIEESGSS